MLKKIQQWLSNPKRDYRAGVAIFKQLATQSQNANFLAFFENVKQDEEIDQFDIRFTTLVNQVLFIENRVKINPEAFAEVAKIIPVNSNIPNPTSRIQLDELPDEFEAERQRLKEIVPIMAKLHAGMGDEKLPDDKRAEIRAELVKLDDERRAIWGKIDTAGIEVEKSPEETEVEKNMMAVGAKTALRIGQLKSYIARNQEALKNHLEAGNQKKADNAQEKIEAYTKELSELEALLPKNE